MEKMKVMAWISDKHVVQEIDIHLPQKGEVRVKVKAASVNPAEEKVLSGNFVGRFLHAKTNPLVVGWDFSGTVDEVGEGVTDVSIGDRVWGHLAFSSSQRQGTYSEYITIARNEISKIPENVSFTTAAATATISMTSLQSIRDLGKLEEGGKVLIVGGGGGIGAISIGIAKKLGAHVTALCSTKDIDRVKELGADEIIDRKVTDPLNSGSTYDVVFDTPAAYSFSKFSAKLNSGGAYVTTLPDAGLITGMIKALFSSKRCHFVQVASKQKDLELVGKWLGEGLEVKIDSSYKIADLDEALSRFSENDRSGKVVVDVEDCWPE